MYTKEELEKAYNAGVKSVEQNKDRDERLEQGTKQIEEEWNFKNYYKNLSLQNPKCDVSFTPFKEVNFTIISKIQEHFKNAISKTPHIKRANEIVELLSDLSTDVFGELLNQPGKPMDPNDRRMRLAEMGGYKELAETLSWDELVNMTESPYLKAHKELVQKYIIDPLRKSHDLGGWEVRKKQYKFERGQEVICIGEIHPKLKDQEHKIWDIQYDAYGIWITLENMNGTYNAFDFRIVIEDIDPEEEMKSVLRGEMIDANLLAEQGRLKGIRLEDCTVQYDGKPIKKGMLQGIMDQHSPVEEVKPYEEKFIVEINYSEFVKVDETDLKGKHVQYKMYRSKQNYSGNAYAQVYDTDPNNAKLFDSYEEAHNELNFEIRNFYSQNKHYSGSVNKIIIARKNDLEKEYKIGETVMAARRRSTDLKEMEIISFSSHGFNEIRVKEKEGEDWFWTTNFKKIK